jgi:hypothetical protein
MRAAHPSSAVPATRPAPGGVVPGTAPGRPGAPARPHHAPARHPRPAPRPRPLPRYRTRR